MANTLEANRYLYLTTPLGDDKLLLQGFSGHEALNQLFSFHLSLLADNATSVDFDKLIGQKVGFGIQGEQKQDPRHFNGIVIELSQGARDRFFTQYHMTVAPEVWKLTRKFRSRIFQHITVPDILKEIFAGYDVAYETQDTPIPFEQREYCTQYQESDFNFASRLMEEEGIYYFFKFTRGAHKLVLANTPQSHPDVPVESKLVYEVVEGGHHDEARIGLWEKEQSFNSGKCTLRDHHFELAHKDLEAKETVRDAVPVGKVQHKLKVGGNEDMEIYEHPGRYAQRFDGIDKAGGEKAADLQKIFKDNKRTAGIRMQQAEAPMLLINAGSNYAQITPGHKFTLQRHFNADGQYVVVQVSHHAAEGSFRSSDELQVEEHYDNTFTCIPFALPYRPPRVTARPLIAGPVTAVVTGPSGEEIFTDKYGRVKVRFHWDREHDYNADSSCWLRVATMWAGKQWGTIFIPRVGHEVVVSFIEGDPDRPIVIGSVYNSDTMPPYELPANKTRNGIKSNSSIGSGGFNEICFEDKKGKEQIRIHGQYDMDTRIEHDEKHWVGRDRHTKVIRDRVEEIDRDEHIKVGRDTVQQIGRDLHTTISGKMAAAVTGSCSVQVTGDMIEQFSADQSTSVTGTCHIKGMNVVIEAATAMTLSVGGNSINLNPGGIQIIGTPMVMINSGGSPLAGVPKMLVSPISPIAALLADYIVPGSEVTYKAQLAASTPAQAAAMTPAQQAAAAAADAPTHNPNSEENKQKKHYIEIELMDENAKPAAGVAYRVTCPDGAVAEGTLDEKGFARVDGIDPGSCKVTFPDLDKEAWEPK
jgi:type VI secretion system secreted protein VgrG